MSIVFAFSGCEKDDICDANTPTTPRLVIEFYNYLTVTQTLKNVTNLRVSSTSVVANIDKTAVSKIQVPLQTNTETTTLLFIQNGSDLDLTNNNTDILTFNYKTYDVYVSRACGFKTLFNLDPADPITKSEPTIPDGAWIKNIVVVKPNLESENEVHVKIYF